MPRLQLRRIFKPAPIGENTLKPREYRVLYTRLGGIHPGFVFTTSPNPGARLYEKLNSGQYGIARATYTARCGYTDYYNLSPHMHVYVRTGQLPRLAGEHADTLVAYTDAPGFTHSLSLHYEF